MIGYILLASTFVHLSATPPSKVVVENLTLAAADGLNRYDDPIERRLMAALAETRDFWSIIFKANGQAYEGPRLKMFRGTIRTGCGLLTTASGLFYCENERELYVDTGFFQGIAELGASGDFAEAFLIAHEVSHHVQNEMGILPNFKQLRHQMGGQVAGKISVRVELQADCFAGMWGHYMAKEGRLEEAFVEQALNAASQLGDDALQLKMEQLGQVVPQTFQYGTSEQRVSWFKRGFYGGGLGNCETFAD